MEGNSNFGSHLNFTTKTFDVHETDKEFKVPRFKEMIAVKMFYDIFVPIQVYLFFIFL